jgi:mTERF domain-containing protein
MWLLLSFSVLITNSLLITLRLLVSATSGTTNAYAFLQQNLSRSGRRTVLNGGGESVIIHNMNRFLRRNKRLYLSPSGTADNDNDDYGRINLNEIERNQYLHGEQHCVDLTSSRGDIDQDSTSQSFRNQEMGLYNHKEKGSTSKVDMISKVQQQQQPQQEQQDTDDFVLPAEVLRTLTPASATTFTGMHIAPASEIAYFYLQDTIGLGPDIMWKISNEAGSVLGFTVKNLEGKISLLTRMMNLSQDDIKEIITKQPSILHMSATRNISPTILFLVRAMDLSKKDLKRIVLAYPCILCYSMHNLAHKISFFNKELGLDVEEMRQFIISEPKLLCSAVDTGLLPRLHFLHKELSIPLEDLRKILRANPRLLLYSLERNLQPKFISFFIMRLCMQPKDILKLLTCYPLIIDYNLENHMLPIARYFLSELEFSPMEMKHILLKFPRLMTHSLFKIKHLVGYLRYELGMNAKEVKRVLFQAPQVISLNTDEKVTSKVAFLKDTFGLSNDKDLRKVVSGMPTILLCNTEDNIGPKAEYLLKEFGGDKMEMRQAVITLPTILGYSLEKRIKPRMEEILDGGLQPIKITIGITMTDKRFQEWLASAKRSGDKKKKRFDWPLAPAIEPSAEEQDNDYGEEAYTTKRKKRKDISKDEANEQDIGNPVASALDGRIMHWKH